MEIFCQQTESLIHSFSQNTGELFELIELGAGDGSKTKVLLKALKDIGFQFTCMPVDISHNALDQLTDSLKKELPEVSVKPQQGDYLKHLAH